MLAYNILGDGEFSNEVTATPVSLDDVLRSYMEDEIVGVYGDASPWLRTAWEHMKQNGKVFRIVETGLGRASVLGICGIDASGLWVCRVASTQIRDSAFY